MRNFSMICPACMTGHPLEHNYTVPQRVYLVCHNCERIIYRDITTRDIGVRAWLNQTSTTSTRPI